MRYQDLFELNSGVMKHFIKMFPNTPDYVIRDFIYKNYKSAPTQIEPEIVEWLNELSWQQQEITVTIDIFDEFTQTRLKQLLQSTGNDERFDTQQSRIAAGDAVNKEPIILTMDGNKYELQEGWHRTVESLRRSPNGYKQVAWIGN
jgi:hypothetical protein